MRYITNATAAAVLALLSLALNTLLISVACALLALSAKTVILLTLAVIGLQMSGYLCFDLLYWQLLNIIEQKKRLTKYSMKGVFKWLMSL